MLDQINKKVVKALLVEIRRSVCVWVCLLGGFWVCTVDSYFQTL